MPCPSAPCPHCHARLADGVAIWLYLAWVRPQTVMETVQEASKEETMYQEMRALLGQFLFKGDDVEKKIRVLSGGEKARVALCRMMLSPANLLVLDEPTNHLDIPAKEMIETALREFDGSVLVVSHDRYFISQVANTVCAFEDGKLRRSVARAALPRLSCALASFV